MNDPAQMMNRGFGIWPPPLPDDLMNFQTPRPVFPAGVGVNPFRSNWKEKKAAGKRKKAAAAAVAGSIPGGNLAGGNLASGGGGGGAASGYRAPALKELRFQHHAKAPRFYQKKKFTRFAPFAPRNTTSFIIRAKKSGGIASLVSPCPVTPAILPTPKFSPSREGLVDMAKEEWGVDGYGSMKGLIRLRSGAACGGGGVEEEEEEEVEEGSSDSDVEEHLEMDERLSRFEMVYPSLGDEQGAAAVAGYLLENRVDDQDTHIATLEEENLTLKERLFLMEREMGDMRRRLQLLETESRSREDDNNDNNNSSNPDKEASENVGGGEEKIIGDYEESNETPMRE